MAVPERGRSRRTSRNRQANAGRDEQLNNELLNASAQSAADLSNNSGRPGQNPEGDRSRGSAKRVASMGVAATVAAGVAVAFAMPAAAAPAATSSAVSAAGNAAASAAATSGAGRPKPAKPTNGDYAGLSAAAKAAAEKAAKAQPAPDADPVEDTAARTANLTTTVDPETGTRTTELSPQAVNFRDDAGDWQPVDNTLVPAGEKAGGPAGGGADTGWANSAAGYDATLPKDLTAPVTLTDGANAQQWVSLQLNPAAPATAPAKTAGTVRTLATAADTTGAAEAPEVAPVAGEVDGSTVAYADVLPGTDVALEAQGSG